MFETLPRLAVSASSLVTSTPFKRAQLGLFHGKIKQSGNSVPFSKKKTRRSWLPNVQTKRFVSEGLDRKVKIKATTKAIRTVKKHGGFDEYLLKTDPNLLGIKGMQLRLELLDKRWVALKSERDANPKSRAGKMPDFAVEVDQAMELERLTLAESLDKARTELAETSDSKS